MPEGGRPSLIEQLRERGVLRVAASYAVIGWLLLQIADVTFDPLGLPKWVMTTLIVAVALGFPVALLLAWFYEIGDHGITRDASPASAPRPHVHGARRYADVAIIGVLLVVVAVLLVRQSDFGKPPPPAKPALAVLPFANLSADPSQAYFSDGLAEEVLDRLGQVPGLMVVARSSSFSFRGEELDVREIAEKLGVNAVLEGAVRRDGKRLRLSAKLIDGKTGYQLWSGNFDREVNDVFAVQAELAQAVIDAIVPVARGDAPVDALKGPPPTTSLTAYDLYLLGKAKANTRWTNSMQKAAEYFEQALEQDPKFTKAQAALALVRVYQINDDELTDVPRERRIEIAEAEVYKALALDPKSPEALLVQANLLRNTRRPGVEEAYRRALDANPNNAEAWHGYAIFLGEDPARRKEAQAATRRGHELDPLNIGPLRNYLGLILRPGAKELRQELERTRSQFSGAPDTLRTIAPVVGGMGYQVEAWKIVVQTRNDPGFTVPRSTSAVGPLGLWLYIDPEYVIANGEPLLGDPELRESRAWLTSMLLTAYGRLGREQDVLRLLDQFAAISGPDAAETNTFRAFWMSVLGHQGEAAAALQKLGPLPAADVGNATLGGSVAVGQSLPAWLRTLRANGRAAEAQALLAEEQARFELERPSNPDEEPYDWVRDAGIAANEGRKAEAIRDLQQAMRWADVPVGFAPELPWFRSLEGDPAYDALLKEWRGRVARARQEMLALDAAPAAR